MGLPIQETQVLYLGQGGAENGNPLQYSCLENPMDIGACQAMVHRVAKSQTRLKLLSMHACSHTYTNL